MKLFKATLIWALLMSLEPIKQNKRMLDNDEREGNSYMALKQKLSPDAVFLLN